jgi:sugar O-acyltransferase (sialic acid O-acetyltransferase NeuD family)
MTEGAVLIIGAGGHASVIVDCLKSSGRSIMGVIDPAFEIGLEVFPDVRCIDNRDNFFQEISIQSFFLANGIGSIGSIEKRRLVFEKYTKLGIKFETVIHPSAQIAWGVHLMEGSQIMAGSIIQPRTRIGLNTIINTGAKIDHDGEIGNHVHIAPGVTISGGVTVEDGVHIGTSAAVIQGVRVGRGSIVGAGVTVLRDVPANTKISINEMTKW